MTTKPWRENDALFKSLLERGQSVERYVAERLRASGFEAWCPGQSVREDISQAGAYFNQTDVYVQVAQGAPPLRIEVKERPKVRFTSPDDIPEHLMPFFICEVKDYDGKPDNAKPHFMIAVSGSEATTGAMVAIRTLPSLAGKWQKVGAYDQVRGRNTLNYAAPRECWRSYDALTVWLAAKVQLARGAVTGARPDHTNWADYQRCLKLLRVKDVEGGVSVDGRRGTLINAQVTVPRMPPGCRVVFLDEKEIVRKSDTRANPSGTPISRDFASEELEIVN